MLGLPLACDERRSTCGGRNIVVRRRSRAPEQPLIRYLSSVSWRSFGLFVFGQWLIGTLVNFCVPMGFFCLLFLGGGPYTVLSSQTVSTLLMSPFLTAILSPLFVPLSLPRAIERGWIAPLNMNRRPPSVLGPRFGWARHAVGGAALCGCCAPLGFVVAAAISPMSGWTFVVGMAGYIGLLAACALPPATILYCTRDNLEHIHQTFLNRSLPGRALRCVCF